MSSLENNTDHNTYDGSKTPGEKHLRESKPLTQTNSWQSYLPQSQSPESPLNSTDSKKSNDKDTEHLNLNCRDLKNPLSELKTDLSQMLLIFREIEDRNNLDRKLARFERIFLIFLIGFLLAAFAYFFLRNDYVTDIKDVGNKTIIEVRDADKIETNSSTHPNSILIEITHKKKK